MTSKLKILLTGVAGFIGFHLTKRLCEEGHEVIGIDNLNDYYSVQLKKDRLQQLDKFMQLGLFEFYKLDIVDLAKLKTIFIDNKIDIIINLAAQAGVRYSLENPHEYIRTNIQGFMNILECCRYNNIRNLIYASSSSVYGSNTKLPFSESDRVDSPVSIYAASKKSNELMAHTYSHLFGLNSIGLRFFTVYGPWGRPDMALFKFTKKILEKSPIPLYNHGRHRRSFTYIDDIIESMIRLIDKTQGSGEGKKYSQIYNIGGEDSIELMDYIHEIEVVLGEQAIYENLPLQLGDVVSTEADSIRLEDEVGFSPSTSIQDGIQAFVDWYKEYFNK